MVLRLHVWVSVSENVRQVPLLHSRYVTERDRVPDSPQVPEKPEQALQVP